MRGLHRVLWVAGWPLRVVLIALIRLYRVTLSSALGGQCRFHPTCSVYAEQAIRNAGALRGSVLAAWRVARCSPLSHGGMDEPPTVNEMPFLYEAVHGAGPRATEYDAVTQADGVRT